MLDLQRGLQRLLYRIDALLAHPVGLHGFGDDLQQVVDVRLALVSQWSWPG